MGAVVSEQHKQVLHSTQQKENKMESKLTEKQKQTLKVPADLVDELGIDTVQVRYDDQCGNGHNSFAITAWGKDMGGCCHDEVVKAFPHLKPFIKWHLTSSDGPMHYIANTVYHASNKDWNGKKKERELTHARSSAVWPDATDEQLSAPKRKLTKMLEDRLPALMDEFKQDMESLGFTY